MFYPPFNASKTKRFGFKKWVCCKNENGDVRRQLQLKETKVRLY